MNSIKKKALLFLMGINSELKSTDDSAINEKLCGIERLKQVKKKDHLVTILI